MITDAQTRLALAQAITAAATTVTQNTWDGLSAATNPGIGPDRRAYAKVSTTLVGGTNIRCELISSASANLSSPTILLVGPTLTTANAVAGATLLDVVIPPTITQRYVGMQFVSTGAHTAGAVEAYIMADVSHMPYPPSNTGY